MSFAEYVCLENYDQSDLEDYVAEYLDNEFNWVMDSQNDGSDLSVVSCDLHLSMLMF